MQPQSRRFVASDIDWQLMADEGGRDTLKVPTRPFRSVRSRTTFAATVVVGITLVAGGIGLVAVLKSRLTGASQTAAQLRARDVAALATSGHLPKTLSIPGEEQALVQVVAADGRVVSSSSNVAGEPPIDLGRSRPGGSVVVRSSRLPIGDGQRFLLVSIGAATPSGPVLVVVAESLEPADETVRAVAVLLAIGLPVLVGLVGMLTRRSVGRALRPVEGIRSEVADITGRDLHRRVAIPSTGDEISELARTMNGMLDRLEGSADAQRRFVADASHELRSPLASLRTVLEVAIEHPTRVDPHDALRDALIDNGRLEVLVADLLTLARVDDGASTLDRAPVELSVLVRECVGRRSPHNEWNLSLQPAWIQGDQWLIARVIRNLCDNAERHSRSRVSISTFRREELAILRVEDDGFGISADDRERVFERFTRLDEARSSDDGGSGLGLSIVREAVRVHGGVISVGDSIDGGAAFEARFPAIDAPT